MAGSFNSKVEINTSEAVQNFRALRQEVKDSTSDFKDFNKVLQDSKQNVVLAAQQMTKLAQARNQNNKSSRDEAQALVAEARAQALATSAADKHNESLAKQATEQARAASAAAQTSLAQERQASVAMRSAQAQNRMADSSKVLTDHLSNSRYLMYDVGAGLTTISAGLMTMPAAVTAVGVSYEQSFANVRRVLEDVTALQEGQLKNSLKDLGAEIPKNFAGLTEIAQLGSQMGIANSQLASFTETTARYASVAGMTNEASSQMFGRMEQFFNQNGDIPDYFNRLGSSVAYVGAQTVATDPEIASMLSQISAAGAQAGFTTPQITGLAAALASVRVRPELGRGFLTTIFNQLNRAVSEGGPKLEAWGKTMGMTSDQVAKLWKSNPSEFFTSFIGKLNESYKAGVPLVGIFDQLGIKQVRYVDALQKLATGYNVLTTSMDAAQKGYDEGSFLDDSSAKVFDTVASKLQILANVWSNLADSIGGQGLAWIKPILDGLIALGTNLDHLMRSQPVLAAIVQGLLGFAAVTAVFIAFKAAQAFAVAGLISFQQAAQNKGITAAMSLSGVLKELMATMRLVGGTSNGMGAQVAAAAERFRFLEASGSATIGQRIGAGMNVAAAGAARFGSGLMSLVGGPIGLTIAAIGLLISALLNAKMEAEATGKAIAEGMSRGAEQGLQAVAQQLTNTKVSGLDNLFFTFDNKNIRQLGDEIGLSFDKLISSASKGKAGLAELDAELDRIAQHKGFKNFDEWAGSMDSSGIYAAALRRKMGELADATDTASKDVNASSEGLKTLGVSASDSADGLDEAGDSVEDLDKKLKDLVSSIFGVVDSEASLQAALQKIGEGLAKGGSYDPGSEVGRTNLKNFEEGLDSAIGYYKQLLESGQMSARQAADSYAAYVDGLIKAIRDKGGDPTPIIELANRTKQVFSDTIGGGTPATLPIQADASKAQASAVDAMTAMKAMIEGSPITGTVDVNAGPAQMRIQELAINLSQITGWPYEVVVDALTHPASEKGVELYKLITSITNHTYTAPINADTSAAIANVQNFAVFASNTLNQIAASFSNWAAGQQGWIGAMGQASSAAISGLASAAAPQMSIPAAPAQVQSNAQAAPKIPTPDFSALNNGYDQAADKAAKAGDAGKKAGKDSADGFKDATEQLKDYVSRLKTGLSDAYDKQYGLQKATDDYHAALNAIKKKRDDELKQLDDLITKQKQLNNERDKDLIDASKAKNEAKISRKYGEFDRAADYDNQAKTALDNAAAKQKDIDATRKQADELRAGIGNLKGYSDAAIANRGALRDLEQKMLDMIGAYANTGKTQQQVKVYAEKLTGQFKKDAEQVFKNRGTVNGLTGDMGRYVEAIKRVPLVKPTKVTADTGGAKGAIDGVRNAIGSLPSNKTVMVHTEVSSSSLYNVSAMLAGIGNITGSAIVSGMAAIQRSRGYAMGGLVGFASGGLVPGTPPSARGIDNLVASVDGGRGQVGIRSGEFIQPQESVAYYGSDFMESIRTRSLPRFTSYNQANSVSGGGSGVVALDAESIALLAQAVTRGDVVLRVDNREIARAAASGARELGDEGYRR